MKQGWEIKKLGEIAIKLFAGGDKPKVFSEHPTDTLKIPVYANGVNLDGLVGYTDKAIVDKESITISARGTIGFCCIRQTPFVPIVRLITIIPTEEIRTRYLYYALSNATIENNGVAIPQLTIPMIKGIPIPVPPREEQERIVAELDCLSGVIERKREQLRELDALAQSIFYQMFGDPITNEKGWDVKKWEEVFDTRTGKLNANVMNENGRYPFFTCSKDIFYIDTYAFDCEALLLAGNNATANYDVKYYKGKFNAYQRTYVLTLKDNSLYKFFKFALENKLSLLQEQSIGGMTKYLTLGILHKIEFIAPPLTLQQEFADKIEAIEKQKELIKKSISEVEDLFNSRMSYYFN